MKTYARIDNQTVVEIIESDSIESMFTAEFVDTLVEITGVSPKPAERWSYIDGKFSAPTQYVRTAEEIKIVNTSTRDYLLGNAALMISPLQDAVDLDDATATEVAMLKKWKQYRVAVNRVDLTVESPAWPTPPSDI